MEQLKQITKPNDRELDSFLGGILAPIRWATILALLLLAFVQPLPGRVGLPIWALILLFAAYNLFVELLRTLVLWMRSYARVSLLDLPVVSLLYSFGATPGGPLYVLFLLIVACAAASLKPRASILYTAAAAGLVALIGPTLPSWRAGPIEIRELGVELVVLFLVGLGMALLMRWLARERTNARSSQAEAERLAELDRVRNDFVATISHDLRTPLTAARAGLGMLETSATERLRSEEQLLLSNIRRNVDRLGRLIDDLLALNLIKAGALEINREPLDLRTMVADVLASVYPLVRKKAQTLEVDFPEPLPYHGDARRLEQVVMNLLSNAHQHTPSGTRITIAGRLVNDAIHLIVSDTGPGIPADEREAIFERFHRLSLATGGNGLGLVIARGLVELHGGQIRVESGPGEGTTFHIELPYQGFQAIALARAVGSDQVDQLNHER